MKKLALIIALISASAASAGILRSVVGRVFQVPQAIKLGRSFSNATAETTGQRVTRERIEATERAARAFTEAPVRAKRTRFHKLGLLTSGGILAAMTWFTYPYGFATYQIAQSKNSKNITERFETHRSEAQAWRNQKLAHGLGWIAGFLQNCTQTVADLAEKITPTKKDAGK